MSGIVRVTTPSRLHFGLLAFGDPSVPQFGGVGVMIDRPGVRITLTAASELELSGPLEERVRSATLAWARVHAGGSMPRCRVVVERAAPLHVGLGTGTQLALAVAAGLSALAGLPRPSPEALAHTAGRGRRSAVGTYGFALGGLIAELGKPDDQALAPLYRRIALPAAWRFVLIRPTRGSGLCGAQEDEMFRQLPPVASQLTSKLVEEMDQHLLPAAEAGDIDAFGESLYHYGATAGGCFAACQGGPFADARLDQWVATIRQLGVRGVGQSSWGPTLFALLASPEDARRFVLQFRDVVAEADATLTIAAVDNAGAVITGPA